MSRRLLAAPALLTVLLVPTACAGGESDAGAQDSDAGGFSAAADTETCLRDATAVTATPDGYPASFPLPSGTVVFNVEDRGGDGVVATGVTATRFDDALHAMNAARRSGFKVIEGETEEGDAEANWTGNGFTGRWAIKKSATCPGETVVQLLSKRS
jgi:hypothetical protein